MSQKYLEFEIEGCRFAIPIEFVFEITPYQKPQRIPNVNFHIEGIVNLRGKVVPVWNLKKLLNLCETEKCRDFVFVEHDSKITALAVDRVIGVTLVEPNEIDTSLAWQIFMNSKVVTGIVKKQPLVAILNIREILG